MVIKIHVNGVGVYVGLQTVSVILALLRDPAEEIDIKLSYFLSHLIFITSRNQR